MMQFLVCTYNMKQNQDRGWILDLLLSISLQRQSVAADDDKDISRCAHTSPDGQAAAIE
jgi:hypothetical protein